MDRNESLVGAAVKGRHCLVMQWEDLEVKSEGGAVNVGSASTCLILNNYSTSLASVFSSAKEGPQPSPKR